MNIETFPPPLPHERPPERGLSRGMLWALIGLGFAVVQFAVSETAFQLAEVTGEERLYDLSNGIAWPAGHLYDRAETRILLDELQEISVSPAVEDAKREAATALLDRRHEGTFLEEAREFADAHEIDAYPGLAMEYFIYGGTCVLWGVVVGLGGYVLMSAGRVEEFEPRMDTDGHGWKGMR